MTFRNPLCPQGADPFLTWHDGWYCLSATRGGHISLRWIPRSPRLRENNLPVAFFNQIFGGAQGHQVAIRAEADDLAC